MEGKLMLRVCTFCNEMALGDSANFMCGKCDREAYAQELKLKKTQSKTKRKCRLCAKALPASRYFECHSCSPDHARGTDEGDWLYAQLGEDEETKLKDPVTRRTPMVGLKKCKACSVEKDRTHFYLSCTARGDTHNTYCKPCHKAKSSQWAKAAEEKRNEASL